MNLANKITITRVFLIPVFMVILFSNFPNSNYIAALIFTIAAATDGLDGYIARSRNQITTFGKFVDPLADKLLVSTALISMVQLGKVPAWIVVIIIAREFTIAVSEGITIAASSLGKIKTVTQLVAIILILIDNYPFRKMGFPLDKIMLYIALLFTIISGIDYIYKNKHVLKSGDK